MKKTKRLYFLLICVSTSLASCGVVENKDNSSPNNENEELIIEVIIESNASYASDLEVEINSRNSPQTVNELSIEVPYSKTFVIPTDAAFPISSTKVKATAGEDGDRISCKILYDEIEVATHDSEGELATAVCENKFIDNILSYQ
ncbi:hypothetical protein ABC0209 [Shouchella clausii KSM-K16]|uniref:Lipoprotein n=1 Tax=Shouchella clausii (strain KSM-K16) TaxID=66692 RepID=Q5WLK3_SHOC1|nr:hypothetical protein [Shouchella clausii]BAD62752.1 hypothetical protein ABC0209 [Shouchella clausii KSM-K16]